MDRKSIVIWSILVLSLIMISSWIYNIVQGQLPPIDRWAQPLMENLSGTPIYLFSREITFLGSYSVIYPVTIAGVIVLLLIYRSWIEGVIYGLGILLTHLLNRMIKELVGRERPLTLAEVNASGESFPSAHAMSSLVCYGLFAYLLCKKIHSNTIRIMIQIIVGLLVLLVGFSRYIINVHFMSDVLAGFIIGILCLIGLILLYSKLKLKWKS